MNIVHVVESLALGGLERVVVSLAQIQLRQRHRVRVVCLFEEGVLGPQVRAAGGDVIVCHKTRGLDLRAIGTLRRAVKDFHADAIHTHNAVAQYYTALATVGVGRTCLLNTRHGMGSFPFSRRRESLYRLSLAGSAAAVSVCDAARSRFVSHRIMPAAKALTVPNGTDMSVSVARHSAARTNLMGACGIEGNPVLFGTVGRLSAAKDHVGLLRAFRVLLDDGIDARLVIVGDGELRAALECERECLQLGAHVHVLGSRSDIPTLLAGLDAFVLSSVTEGYSLALVEACAAALPCVVTDVGGNREIVRDGQTGLVVPAADAERLAHAMKTLASDAALRDRMGRNARAWALEHGTLEAMCGRYLAIYQRCNRAPTSEAFHG